jgi:hypothetical protein
MKGDLEAFSDGVFAIAATLLVLDIRDELSDRGIAHSARTERTPPRRRAPQNAVAPSGRSGASSVVARRSVAHYRERPGPAHEGRAGGPGGRCYGARVLGDPSLSGLREIGRYGRGLTFD